MTKIAHLLHIVLCWNSQVWQQETILSTNILNQKHTHIHTQYTYIYILCVCVCLWNPFFFFLNRLAKGLCARAFWWAIIKCLWCYLRLGVCWHGGSVFLCNLLVSWLQTCYYNPNTLAPERQWHQHSFCLYAHHFYGNCSAGPRTSRYFAKFLIKTHLFAPMEWEKNKKVPPAPILTHFYQLMTLAYIHHCDEPPDHIFTVDNLFPAGCSTLAIRRVRGHPFDKRKRKLSALNQTPIRLPQQVCSLLISNMLVTDCLWWAMDPQILLPVMGATGE